MAIREINLLPEDMLYSQRIVRHICFWAACLAVSLTFVMGIYLYEKRLISKENFTLMRLKADQKHLGEKIEEIRKIQIELESLAEKKDILKVITANQPYSEILQKLSEIMNEHTWLTQLVIDRDPNTKDRDDNKIKLKLRGVCHSNEDLGDFLIQLSTDPLFKGVALNFAKESKQRHVQGETRIAVNLIEFQIDAHV